MLSTAIRNYQDGKFDINPPTYSPDDIAILRCFIPDPAYIEDGEVEWSEMRKKIHIHG